MGFFCVGAYTEHSAVTQVEEKGERERERERERKKKHCRHFFRRLRSIMSHCDHICERDPFEKKAFHGAVFKDILTWGKYAVSNGLSRFTLTLPYGHKWILRGLNIYPNCTVYMQMLFKCQRCESYVELEADLLQLHGLVNQKKVE